MKRELLFAAGMSIALVPAVAVNSSHEIPQAEAATRSVERVQAVASHAGFLATGDLFAKPTLVTPDVLPGQRPDTQSLQPPTPKKPKLAKPPLGTGKILFIGDSYGEGAEQFLEQELKTRGWSTLFDVHCGRPLAGGPLYTSCDPGRPQEFTALYQILQPEDRAFIARAQIVGVEIGTNNVYEQPDKFAAEAALFVRAIKAINPSAKIDWINTFVARREGEGPVTNLGVGANQGIAKSGASVVNYARGAESFYPLPPYSTRIHPIEDGYKKLAEDFSEAVGLASNEPGRKNSSLRAN